MGKAERVAAAVNCSVERLAVCNRRPLGIVKSRRSYELANRVSSIYGFTDRDVCQIRVEIVIVPVRRTIE